MEKNREDYLQFLKDLKNTEVYVRRSMSKSVYLHVDGYTLWPKNERVYSDPNKNIVNGNNFKYLGSLDELLQAVNKRVNRDT